MIKFVNNNISEPYLRLERAYNVALEHNQLEIQALLIGSYSPDLHEVDARYVNLKMIDDEKFIFFSNYNSPKAQQFSKNNQIIAVIYWPTTNTQIRMKAKIRKTSKEFSDQYFKKRTKEKNALAISSNQSEEINDYGDVINNYEKVFSNEDMTCRPNYWGGYYFIPYYFEFWQGDTNRLNKRVSFNKKGDEWIKSYLQP
tara:strand:- start:227 stop:823 length:597 start_codon:yes stop_codon:yes gene_type:complete